MRMLAESGVIRFELRDSCSDYSVGVFFVEKANGKLRMVFDTRKANCDFVNQVSTKLPSFTNRSALKY